MIKKDGFIYSEDLKTILGFDEDYEFGEEIFIPEGVEEITIELKTVSMLLANPIKKVHIPKSLFESSCEPSLTFFPAKTFVIPDGIEEIPASFFLQNSSVENVIIPPSVKKIGSKAFAHCQNLKNIDISNIEIIGEYAFTGTRLTSVEITNNTKNIEPGTFAYCIFLETLMYDTETDVPADFCNGCVNLKNIFINDNVKKIKQSAFMQCFSMHEIKLPKALKEILTSAFCDTGLYEICFGDDIELISNFAFSKCSSLSNITFPEKAKIELQFEAFSQCNLLKHVVLPKSVEFLGQSTFAWCENLKSIEIQSKVKEIPKGFATQCKKLSSVKLPDTIEKIEPIAFYGCNLKDINDILKSVKLIDEDAFSCNPIERLYFRNNTVIKKSAFSGLTDLKLVLALNNDLDLDSETFGDTPIKGIKKFSIFKKKSFESIGFETVSKDELIIKLLDDFSFKDTSSIINTI